MSLGLTHPLATAEAARGVDEDTVGNLALPGRLLMEVAGARAADAIWDRLGRTTSRILVLCGPGNNGGDGYVVARHLRDRGCEVVSVALSSPNSADARAAQKSWLCARGAHYTGGCEPALASHAFIATFDLVVDAMLGVGLVREVTGVYAEWIDAVNQAPAPLRVALDIPTGVCADTGAARGVCFCAHLTLTFGLHKLGLTQGQGLTHAGEVVVVPVGFCADAVKRHCATLRLAKPLEWIAALPRRDAIGHKGVYGHLALVGGRHGLRGAIELAGRASLRIGVGRVTWCYDNDTPPTDLPAELMQTPLANADTTRFTAALVGPGLQRDSQAREIIERCWEWDLPSVFDADALRLLRGQPKRGSTDHHRLLLPHPGEAAALLGCSTAEVQRDRLAAVREVAVRYNSVIALKGENTLVANPAGLCITVPGGAPTLSVGGSGDVLAGACAALIAQGVAPLSAAVSSAALLVASGQSLGASRAQRGVLPSELADALPVTLNQILAVTR